MHLIVGGSRFHRGGSLSKTPRAREVSLRDGVWKRNGEEREGEKEERKAKLKSLTDWHVDSEENDKGAMAEHCALR